MSKIIIDGTVTTITVDGVVWEPVTNPPNPPVTCPPGCHLENGVCVMDQPTPPPIGQTYQWGSPPITNPANVVNLKPDISDKITRRVKILISPNQIGGSVTATLDYPNGKITHSANYGTQITFDLRSQLNTYPNMPDAYIPMGAYTVIIQGQGQIVFSATKD